MIFVSFFSISTQAHIECIVCSSCDATLNTPSAMLLFCLCSRQHADHQCHLIRVASSGSERLASSSSLHNTAPVASIGQACDVMSKILHGKMHNSPLEQALSKRTPQIFYKMHGTRTILLPLLPFASHQKLFSKPKLSPAHSTALSTPTLAQKNFILSATKF